MNNHKNARITVHGRLLLVRRIVEHGLRAVEAAQAMGVSPRTAYKWLRRYRDEGEAGLQSRSSRSHRCPHATADTAAPRAIELRHRRQTYRQIALSVGISQSTVGRILARAGLNRLSDLDPVKPDNRYEHADPATQEGGKPGNLFTPLDRRYTNNDSFSSYPKESHIF